MTPASARTPASPLRSALERGPLVLDGGLSNQLEAQGCDLSDELWSARLLADAPEQIEAAHLAYVRAGAQVLITSSYQASFEGFARRGLGSAEAGALFRRSVELARAAAARAAGDVWVAGSVGPYGAVRADGSEYRGRYGRSVRELAAFHRPRVAALAEAEPDVLALETVPDADEVEALLLAVEGCGLPVWLSCTVDGGRTRAGQPLARAFAPAAGNDQVIAVGVNCCAAAEVDGALEAVSAVTGKPAVVYPNSGEGWDARARAWRGSPTFGGPPGPASKSEPEAGKGVATEVESGAGAQAAGWADRGARLIGGCCRVGPEGIAEVARALHDRATRTA